MPGNKQKKPSYEFSDIKPTSTPRPWKPTSTRSQRDLVAAEEAGDNSVADELMAEWRSRLQRALRNNPEAVETLRDVLSQLGDPTQDPSAVTQRISLKASASGHARVYQQGQGTQRNG